MIHSARLARQRGAVRVYEYPIDKHMPPVVAARVGQDQLAEHGQVHNFPALWCDQAGGVVHVIAMGATIDRAQVQSTGDGLAVFFDPAALGAEDGASPWLTWRSHPLLCLFLHGRDGGLWQLSIPDASRPAVDGALSSMRAELFHRQGGYRQAVVAHLSLLLIELARLAGNTIGELRRGDPLLDEVFTVIDRHYREPLTLSDVAREVSVSAGHLTTQVRQRTGRTVQAWIVERRMAEARRLLADTRLSITDVADQVGLPDAGYFARQFRQEHACSPSEWRKGRETRRR